MRLWKVVLTADAEEDLRDIVDFIDQHDGWVRADEVLSQLETAVDRLETFPVKNPIVKELRDIGVMDFREAYFKPYRLVYRVSEKRVDVHLICDGRRDMTTLLQQRLLRVRAK
jgi:toxin ParE1/3/4